MTTPLPIYIEFDLLKVGHCSVLERSALRGGRRQIRQFPALVGLIRHPQQGFILYDTGYSPHFFQATKKYPECIYRTLTPAELLPEEELLTQLSSRGIASTDIRSIIISHFHADHIAGLRDFPCARFIAFTGEYIRSKQRRRLFNLCRAFLPDLLPKDFESRLTYAETFPVIPLPIIWAPFMEAYDLLGDNSLLAVPLPGHTSSQLGLVFHTKQGGPIFLVGDAVWTLDALTQNRRPSRAAYALFDSARAYDETFSRLQALHNTPNSPRIIPSHCTPAWKNHNSSKDSRYD